MYPLCVLTAAAGAVILLSSSTAGLMAGAALSGRLKARRRYFEELVSLLNSLIGDVRFLKTNVAGLLTSFRASALGPTVNEFVAYVEGKRSELTLPRGYLTEREHRFAVELFSALGTFDEDTQVFMLEGYKAKAEEFYAAAAEREKKYAGAYLRLGLLGGLALGIMIV